MAKTYRIAELEKALADFVAAAENNKLEMYRCGYCFYLFEGEPLPGYRCPKCRDTALKRLIFADTINAAVERAKAITEGEKCEGGK